MKDAVVHGSISEEERAAFAARGLSLLDLSASLNPYGPHPHVVRAARRAAVDRYPEADAGQLRAAYAAAHSLNPDSVLVGSGSSELIYLATRAAAKPGCVGLVLGPTFGEYARAICAAGMRVKELNARPPAFDFDVIAAVAEIERLRPAIAFVCNPNNPTGRMWRSEDIERLTGAVSRHGGWTVVDEAYADFADRTCAPVAPAGGRITLRSLTKLHAIPGLRLGFAIAPPDIIGRIAALQPPWAVSAPAIAGGLQALQERDFAARSIRRIVRDRSRLARALRGGGLNVVDSSANFVLVRVGDAFRFRRALMGRGFVVRDCTSFGLPEYVRVAIPRASQVERLATAMLCVHEEAAL